VFHAPFLNVLPGFELYGVWERSKRLAQEKYPQVKTFRSLDDLLADEKIELVIVNTPNYTHYEYAKLALEAGKHVVVEKPFTVMVNEGEELIQLAKEKGVMLSVYQNRRFDSDFRTIRKVVSEGLLGDIVEAEFHFDRFREDLSPKQHKEVPGPGTGALYDLGSHLVDQALQLFGFPEAIFADIRIVRPVSKVDDYFEVLLYYPSLRVRLHSSYLVKEALPGYILHGSKGSFIKAKTDVQETDLQAGKIPCGPDWGKEPDSERGLLHIDRKGEDVKEYLVSLQGNYGDYFEGVYEAIRMGKPAPVSAEDGLDVIRVITAAFKSSEEQKVIRLS
jgi:predicted dehydrogenase